MPKVMDISHSDARQKLVDLGYVEYTVSKAWSAHLVESALVMVYQEADWLQRMDALGIHFHKAQVSGDS